MGGLYLTQFSNQNTQSGLEDACARVENARKQFVRHGFSRFNQLKTAHYCVLVAHSINRGPDLFASDGEDWIAAAGTLVYKGEAGAKGMTRLLREFTFPFSDWESVSGQFVLVVHTRNQLHVLTDYSGAFQVFTDKHYRTLSTSLLSIAAEQKSLHFNQQAVYEHVFNAHAAGDDTVFSELERLGPDRQLQLSDKSSSMSVPLALTEKTQFHSVSESLSRVSDRLLSVAQHAVDNWGSRIQCPLSGGLDSRLVLGLLRKVGATPHVYVYGSPENDDVVIARQLGRQLGFEVEVFDKPAWREIEKVDYAAQVEQNFHECDALVTDAGIFDNGANAVARKRRQAEGALAMSGGCGEVLRNFFFLPDRELQIRDVVRAFFSSYDSRHLTNRFDPKLYEELMVEKAMNAIGTEQRSVSRLQLEALYPALRCRAFFGREISIVGRHGGYLMPFLEFPVVQEGLSLPMELKHAGKFEAQLMRQIDPELAALPSAYGHTFAEPVSKKHRFDEFSTMIRPIALRKSAYAIRQRLQKTRPTLPNELSDDFLSTVLDTQYPLMSQFFHMDKITNPEWIARISALEYLGAHFSNAVRA